MAMSDRSKISNLCYLLLYGGTKVCRALFEKRVNDLMPDGEDSKTWTVDKFLQLNRKKLESKLGNEENEKQKLVFPEAPRTTNIKLWDVSLFCLVLRETCDLKQRNKIVHHLNDDNIDDSKYAALFEKLEVCIDKVLSATGDETLKRTVQDMITQLKTGLIPNDELLKVEKNLEDIKQAVRHEHKETRQVIEKGMQTVTSMLDKMMRYQIEILRRIGGHAQVENPPPEMAMEVRTCNCSHQVETSTSRMMAELFNEDTCIYNDTELPACTEDVKELRHAVNDLCSEFKERGCTIKKTEVGCIVLHIQCSSILSLLTLLRDYVDGTLDILLKKLEEAARSLNGCEKLRLETVIYVDEFNRVLSALNFEQFLKEDPSSDLTLPEDFQILETATVDNNLPSATKIKSAYKELKHQENTVSSRSINAKRKTEPGLTRSTVSAYQEGKEWNRTFSSVVCFLLDNLGYSDDMRKYRECANDAIVNLESRHFRFSGITLIAVGSRAEGASLPLCGGTDLMFVTQDVSCVENNFISSDFHILKAERNDSVPPGYTRVAAVDTKDLAILGQIISSSKFHFTQDGISYVSCAIFKNISKKKLLSLQILSKADQVIGPSCFVTDGNTVFSICFYSSLYTSKLATRLSRRDWFSRSLIDNICSTEGYIVPMGSSKGENPDLEWRISYVMTENKIIRNLNSTQFKLYIIMKMIAKELIYQDFPVISSYVVKNVVLWICELNSEVRDSNPRVCSLTSSPDLLLDQIVKCLSFMRTCAIKNHLPNYVIPERNLIAFRPTLRNKQKLINRLDDLIKEGRNIFCRLNIFKKHSQLSLILAPSSIFFYGKKRDEIEKLLLLLMGCLLIKHFVIDQLCGKTGSLEDFHISDQRILALTSELADLVVPERMILSGNFQMLSDLLGRRLEQYLS